MPSPFRSLPFKALLAVVVTAICVGIGVVRATPPKHAPADPLATRLAAVDTTALTVRRAAFCSALPEATVTAALGGRITGRASWHPGQTVQLSTKVKDVADEYGCSWTSSTGGTARAWVFEPPVTADRAARLAAAKPTGCTSLTGTPAPAYGAPTSALACGDSTLLRGLFGDAWLSCELSGTDLDLVGRWCLAVARAAA
ncbi:hypothetical protein P5P86_06665 [Nocardioides sp. BP30]|uniref:hypothetical protein n=1 Tax=Nocardioides sp. BP30 TaxID=3036374 RepID=UPI002468AC54|nr:hypothetical protein [Nocardioides sp. BP30]WGL53510.1 hypothetical protein P5P86_06665 [Nocardioides sp. BP30]